MSVALLVSTYELGGRPIGLTTAAGALRAAGHEVLTCDLSLEDWPSAALAGADCLCCSVPMHTALRLGAEVARRARSERPGLPIFFYGLYAEVARVAGLLEEGDGAFARDEAAELVARCDRLGARSSTRHQRAAAPDHFGLPALGRYAPFVTSEERRLVATVATTIGCNHRCRHCPVPVVYHGRSTAIDAEVVAGEIAVLVFEGASHVHFADPDFLNRPQHARRVVAALHDAHPEVTFDATVKVSHLLRFPELIGEFAACGLVSVISAFESTSDEVLARLDKGHRASDLHRCVEMLRAAGVEPRPSLLPFTPWTTHQDLVRLLDFVASHDLIDNVDAVQYSIRLLLPPGSLLLDSPDPLLAEALRAGAARRGDSDGEEIALAWASADPVLDELAGELALLAEEAGQSGVSPSELYGELRGRVFGAIGLQDPGAPPLVVAPGPPGAARGRIDEPWFCCSEPTLAQLGRVGAEGEREHEGGEIFLGAAIPTLRVKR